MREKRETERSGNKRFKERLMKYQAKQVFGLKPKQMGDLWQLSKT